MALDLHRTHGNLALHQHWADIELFQWGGFLLLATIGSVSIVFLTLSTTTKHTLDPVLFNRLQPWIWSGFWVILFASLVSLWFETPILWILISLLACIIFTAFIYMDLQRIVNQGESNYITATLNLYLDGFNLFVNLLNLLGLAFGKRD